MRRARLIPLLVCLVEPAALSAQWQLTADLGRSRIEQPELPTSSATTAAVAFDYAREHSLIHSSVLGAQTGDGRQTGQWLTMASLITPSWRSWALQGTGAFSAFGQTGLSATTSRDLLAQAQTGGIARGVAIGGGLGTTIHNAVAIPNRRAVGDGWFSFGSERFNGDVALTRTRSVFGGSSILVDISRRSVNYLDVGGGWTHEGASWSVGASAGGRGHDGLFIGSDGWQAVSATAFVARYVAVTFDAGRTLEDLVRGVPRTRYLGIGVRIASRPHLTIFRRIRLPAGPRIAVSRVGDARRIDISNVTAVRVELMADFTDWSAVALEAVGGGWRLDRAIPPGLHRVAIRIDGGEWIVPANLPRADDDLAGTIGIITVP